MSIAVTQSLLRNKQVVTMSDLKMGTEEVEMLQYVEDTNAC